MIIIITNINYNLDVIFLIQREGINKSQKLCISHTFYPDSLSSVVGIGGLWGSQVEQPPLHYTI